MKKYLVILLTILTLTQVKAQLIKEKSIDASIGYGISSPYDDVDIIGSGFYLQGEYVLTITKWIDIRSYAGLILTKTDENEQNAPEYESTTRAFLIGGKTRIKAPIPWVAPYLEFGIGASIGSFETVTPFTNINDSGLIMHIPFSFGLELGPKHNYDIAFTYYFQNTVEQFAGAVAVGISIPLKN
ncbi:hypothetical protein [Aquimarina sp. 2201CG14-23]|uniref:hypothetical protein n=1 Tax=Aquimarina mycalae TaxID=3040073 RepID=UPI0024780880|nr:hypothetical protein [Aquimarina sp. 2201CG14-23]MDH7444809.1 hypothetical protein [Aquimarina sp. 2201CG14-23]